MLRTGPHTAGLPRLTRGRAGAQYGDHLGARRRGQSRERGGRQLGRAAAALCRAHCGVAGAVCAVPRARAAAARRRTCAPGCVRDQLCAERLLLSHASSLGLREYSAALRSGAACPFFHLNSLPHIRVTGTLGADVRSCGHCAGASVSGRSRPQVAAGRRGCLPLYLIKLCQRKSVTRRPSTAPAPVGSA